MHTQDAGKSRRPSPHPLLTSKRRQLQFNSAFCEQAGFDREHFAYVTLYLDDDNPGVLGFTFHTRHPTGQNAYKLSGTRKGRFRNRIQVEKLSGERPHFADIAESGARTTFSLEKALYGPPQWKVSTQGETESGRWHEFSKGPGSKEDASGNWLYMWQNCRLKFGADFCRRAGVHQCSRVSFRPEPANAHRLSVLFHNNADTEERYNYKVRQERVTGGAVVDAQTLYTDLGFEPVAGELRRLGKHRFPIAKSRDPQWQWVVTIAPGFEKTVKKGDEAQVRWDTEGIYRYRRDQDTIYIGHGQLRSRWRRHARKRWQYESIEYSEMQDEGARQKWERFWLEVYEAGNGRLPTENRAKSSGL